MSNHTQYSQGYDYRAPSIITSAVETRDGILFGLIDGYTSFEGSSVMTWEDASVINSPPPVDPNPNADATVAIGLTAMITNNTHHHDSDDDDIFTPEIKVEEINEDPIQKVKLQTVKYKVENILYIQSIANICT